MREVLFSVTAKDCRWDYYRGSGAGGQHRNKTDSAVRCTHIESGAVGRCEDTRHQHKNKTIAFGRMAATKEFKAWHKIETSRQMGNYVDLDKKVDKQMRNVKVEIQKKGRWVDENV